MIDIVCKQLDETHNVESLVYDWQKYFCSIGCQAEFETNISALTASAGL